MDEEQSLKEEENSHFEGANVLVGTKVLSRKQKGWIDARALAYFLPFLSFLL